MQVIYVKKRKKTPKLTDHKPAIQLFIFFKTLKILMREHMGEKMELCIIFEDKICSFDEILIF